MRKNEKCQKWRFFTKSNRRAVKFISGARIVWEDLGHFCKKYSKLWNKIHLSVTKKILSIPTLRNWPLKMNGLMCYIRLCSLNGSLARIFPFLMIYHAVPMENLVKNNCLDEWIHSLHWFSEILVKFSSIVFQWHWAKNRHKLKLAIKLYIFTLFPFLNDFYSSSMR